MKGTTLLERLHRRVEQLMDAVESERYVRSALLEELADDLSATLTLEEAIFYPAVSQALGATAPPSDDHSEVARALQRLFESARPPGETTGETPGEDETEDAARFRAELASLRLRLRARFEHEERVVFPAVEGALSRFDLEQLGEQMKRLRCAIVEADGEPTSSSIGRPSRADWYRFELHHS
jgi:hypothetical protein